MKTIASAYPAVFLCYQNRQPLNGPWNDATRPEAYPRNAHPAGKPPWRWGLRALAAVATASALAACAQAPQTATAQSSPAGSKGTVVQDNKQQLLGFLTRLKQAIDADVVGKPERLREVLGLEVLEWDQLEGASVRFARRWRYNVLAMDAEPKLFEKPAAGYSLGSLNPAYSTVYGLRAANLESVSCISSAEVEAIFGRASIQYTPVPAPLHGILPQPNAPRWWANAYYYTPDTKTLLALSYASTDGPPPVATCLRSIAVEMATGLPNGYPQ